MLFLLFPTSIIGIFYSWDLINDNNNHIIFGFIGIFLICLFLYFSFYAVFVFSENMYNLGKKYNIVSILFILFRVKTCKLIEMDQKVNIQPSDYLIDYIFEFKTYKNEYYTVKKMIDNHCCYLIDNYNGDISYLSKSFKQLLCKIEKYKMKNMQNKIKSF